MPRPSFSPPSNAAVQRLLSALTTASGIAVAALLPAIALGVVMASSPWRPLAQTLACAAALSAAAWGLTSERAVKALGLTAALVLAALFGMLAMGAAWASAAQLAQPSRALPLAQAQALLVAALVAGLPGFIALRSALGRLVRHFESAREG